MSSLPPETNRNVPSSGASPGSSPTWPGVIWTGLGEPGPPGGLVRNVPGPVEKALKRLAKSKGTSLNAVLVEALTRAAGVNPEDRRYHDLDDLFGTWVEDPEFDEAILAQHQIDAVAWQ